MNATKPFEQYKVYGPYQHSGDGRKRIILVPLDEKINPNSRLIRSYARYLLSTKLKRLLADSEEVDHIDGNSSNDNINNLQILSKQEHTVKSKINIKSKMVNLQCPLCGILFVRRHGQTHLVKNRGASTCCSRSCGTKLASNKKKKQYVSLENNVVDIFYTTIS